MTPLPVKALLFDVFGTLADWRSSIAREAPALLAAQGIEIDGDAFADAWRAQYQPAMEEVRSGRLPFCRLDELHLRNLDRVLRQFGLQERAAPLRAELNFIWHRLDAWPDVGRSLQRLRRRFLLAPCSNGNIALMADLARHNGWHWDAILGAEIAGDYKPKPQVYLASAAAFGCEPGEAMMVAAHSADLAAAAAAGLRTAFVARPDEYGPATGEARPNVPVDVQAASLTDLAALLNCGEALNKSGSIEFQVG
jgi:2-haloacid dehalogenase